MLRKSTVAAIAGTALFGLVWAAGCKKDTIDPGTWQPITMHIPPGWDAPYYSFANNELTWDKFSLGRKLFYDVRLSRDSSISCGSCHQQFASFAQAGHDLSHGVEDRLGVRNSPGLANMAWHTSFFWDGGVNNLENQPINPIQNPLEMDLPIAEAVKRVAADAVYRKQFSQAFGDETVNSQRIFKALAQFMALMVSADSKYDKHVRNEAGGTFDAHEERGLVLFRQHCAACHKEPLFSDFSFRNNGLIPEPTLHDSGRARITGDMNDLYKFKVPSLRDVGLTAPYMHDGRLRTLDDVLEHYNTGVAVLPTTDPILKDGIKLSDDDKKDLKAFLNTLTDSTFIKNTLFSEPSE